MKPRKAAGAVLFEHFGFVLFKPKSAGNIGAAARAIKNMGFSDLVLVRPASFQKKAATDMAVHARDILDSARVTQDLRTALHGFTIAVGTTARTGPYRSGAMPLRAAAAQLVDRAAAGDRIALIFGPEDFGLTNEELKQCDRLIRIPTSAEYSSLNLAQSVMLVAYEIMLAQAGLRPRRADSSAEDGRPAVAEINDGVERLKSALLSIGFLPEDNPEHIMHALREVIGRARVSKRDLDIINGIARQIGWFAEGGHETIERKRRAGKRIR